nr:hypothetical protein [Tanacetum cinerariifolium]
MHNDIMAAGSRYHPPVLATGRYTQWQSCLMRYVDTRLNTVALRRCILQEQADWLDDTDEELDEQKLEAHYSFMAKIQEAITVNSNVIPDSSDMCDNDNQVDQNAKECDDERVVLANLIENLKLDTDENKKIQKQLKKANTSLSHDLKECKYALEE